MTMVLSGVTWSEGHVINMVYQTLGEYDDLLCEDIFQFHLANEYFNMHKCDNVV